MLYSIIVSLLLGLLAVFPPYLGFLYTGKIIKEFKDRGIKKGLIVFFLSGIGISLVFNVIPLIAMFFSIYGVILVLYLIFEKYDIGEWNKAFMSTVISMLLLGIIYLLNRDFFLNLKVVFIEQVLVTIKKVEPSISGDEALKMTKDIFNELLVYSTAFVFLQNLLTSFTINLKKSIVQFDTSLIDIFNSIFSKSDKNEVSVINNLNLNAFVYNMKFKLKGYGKMAPHVYREHLNKDFFSTEASRDLLFYDEDLKYLKLESDDNIKLMNKNFNTLAKALAKRNIKLIFMPAVDKYNLYSPYIISNTYQKSIFFEYLDSLPKDYIFINTKKIPVRKSSGQSDRYLIFDILCKLYYSLPSGY